MNVVQRFTAQIPRNAQDVLRAPLEIARVSRLLALSWSDWRERCTNLSATMIYRQGHSNRGDLTSLHCIAQQGHSAVINRVLWYIVWLARQYTRLMARCEWLRERKFSGGKKGGVHFAQRQAF
jgi:hypothetical protein